MIENKAFFNIGYGLYVVTSNDGVKDNGLIVNTVMQVADNPVRIGVCINKANYSCEIINKTKEMNVNCLTTETPFSVFKQFGFVSGRNENKFAPGYYPRTDNGLIVLDEYINSFISLHVEDTFDLGSHLMFICSVNEAQQMFNKISVTYDYYQKNIKTKPVIPQSEEVKEKKKKHVYVCQVCGHVEEFDEEMPDDYICPLCKHGKESFDKIS